MDERRERIATAVLAVFASRPDMRGADADFAKAAVSMADALIAALDAPAPVEPETPSAPVTPAPRPPSARAAPAGDEPTNFPNYGRRKGAPIFGASMEDLEFYASRSRASLADPAKARWHDKERELLAAIEAEIERQGGTVAPPPPRRRVGAPEVPPPDEEGFAPPPPVDDDIPF